jgi:hypothetical protein
MPIRIGFDIGGVLSKYPDLLRPIVTALLASPEVEVHVLSDMFPHEKCVAFVRDNGFLIPPEHIHSCDYGEHGELCKAEKMRELSLDIMLDDFPGYLAEGCALRLLVMPDPNRPYYADDWKTDGSEGNFGRRKPPTSV